MGALARRRVAHIADRTVTKESPAGSVAFEHDLIGEYLAARRLAEDWRAYLHAVPSLGDYGAWLFVAAFTSADTQPTLFREVAQLDPLLASEMALACGAAGIAGRELCVLRPSQNASELSWWKWAVAVGTVGTEECRQALVDVRAHRPDLHHQTQRGLCIAGDKDELVHVLSKANRMVSIYMQTSGGELAAWDAAPPAVALQLARAALDSAVPDDAIGASVRTLARFGDAEDVTRLAQLATTRGDLQGLFLTCDALWRLDASQAQAVLRHAASQLAPED